MEETHQEQKCCSSNEYKIHHFLRNVCCPSLAELLAKELKNCKFIQNEVNEDRESTLNKTLYEILKAVDRKGRRKTSKKKPAEEKSDSVSKTLQLNNLSDYETLLSQVRVYQFMKEAELKEESNVVRILRKLDPALLLHILTNEVLEFPLLGLDDALNTLKDNRNIIYHDDCRITTHQQKLIWDAVECIQKYLGKNMVNFQEKKKCYLSSSQSTCCSLMRELQREINQNYSKEVPHNNYNMHSTIKHSRKESHSCEIVENQVKFLKDHRTKGNQEPRPILLCGATGAGKTVIFHNLVHAIIQSEDFLVVLIDWAENSYKTKESFWEGVYSHLMKFSRLTVQKYGEKDVKMVLENYSSKFLFLWDLNLQDTRKRFPQINRGTWVLSYQGVLEFSTNYSILKVAPLSEKQVREVLWCIKSSEDHYDQVLQCYNKCEYKGFITTPDMVRIFDSVCLGMTEYIPFYRLVQVYINNKIGRTEENRVELIKLGRKAFDTILYNRKYYSEDCLSGIKSNVYRPFLKHSLSKGYCFEYHVVEDYLAALYIVEDPKEACGLWLKQTTLFKRVFEIVCALWCEEDDSQCNNLGFIREYLERCFDISKPVENRVKKKKNRSNKNEGDGAKAKNIEHVETMEVDGDDNRAKKQKDNQVMEVDDNDDLRGSKWNKQAMKGDGNKYGKKQKNNQAMKVGDEDEDDTRQNFVRWVFLSKIAREHKNRQDILKMLAEMLVCKQIWNFKCKSLSEVAIDNISLVLRYINLTKTLTIKLESGPNVTLLQKLWNMLCSHQGVCTMANVQLVIHYTDNNWIPNKNELSKLPSMIVKSETPLHITKYVGPLLCSNTPQFMKSLCMARLKILDVLVCDLASLQEVLGFQHQSVESVIVRLNLKMEEQIIPNAMKIKLSEEGKGIRDLKINYFRGLQRLLDTFEPPDLLHSLKIYRVFIHENFKLDLRRFTKMKSLFIRFVYTGRLPPLSAEVTPSEEKMEMDKEDIALKLPPDRWPFELMVNLHLPVNLERFMMRNLSFCDDSRPFLLHNRYWKNLPFQRLVLLDTNLSLSKFKDFLNSGVEEDISKAIEKKCRVDGAPGFSGSVIKRERLNKQEREERRKHKPEGKELIITSEVQLCKEGHHLSCTCSSLGINNSRDTYQDLISLVKDVYSSEILNVSYSGRGVVVRKDMCGDVLVQCPLPFLDDQSVHEGTPELLQILDALALAQIICLSHTKLSHKGATYLVDKVRERKNLFFCTIEPFRLTILSSYYHDRSITKTEVQHSSFIKKIKNYDCLKQFNFKCDCFKRCHNLKKSIKGDIYFNNTLL